MKKWNKKEKKKQKEKKEKINKKRRKNKKKGKKWSFWVSATSNGKVWWKQHWNLQVEKVFKVYLPQKWLFWYVFMHGTLCSGLQMALLDATTVCIINKK